MKSTAVPLTILSTLLICMTGSAQEAPAIEEAPLYQKLYEEGFYDTAITLLDSLIAADSTGGRELLRYLAFCHIARGDGEAGVSVFERILDPDPGFRLDTLLTPPKILTVFLAVLERRESGQARPDSNVAIAQMAADETEQVDSIDNRADTAASAVRRDSADTGTKTVVATAVTMKDARGRPSVKYVPGLLPGGAGQFYHRQWIKGALLLAAQAAALAGCVWSYHTRQTCYDDRYGWHQGNMTAYNRYTTYTRLGSVVFIGAYTFSVIDYFSGMHKKRTALQRR
jgi:hypothetical protein